MKRILTVQDVSCVGKCALTVALPVISACGVETAVLPTALLSTHTAFRHVASADLSDRFEPIAEAWQAEGITFDGLYTGYLANERQIEAVLGIKERFLNPGAPFFVDPVMADDGKLYAGFSEGFVGAMRRLCAEADVTVPNISEACLLLGVPYTHERLSEREIGEMLPGLTALGCRAAFVTGVHFDADRIGYLGYEAETGGRFAYATPRYPVSFPGTGDVFASAAFGAIARGLPIGRAMPIAARFTYRSIGATLSETPHNWYGVNFETALPELIREIEKAEKGGPDDA